MTKPFVSIPEVCAQDGERANAVARIVCQLVLHGSELDELVDRTVIQQGEPRTIKVPPQIWFDRLLKAVNRGFIETMEEKDIVARILIPLEKAA